MKDDTPIPDIARLPRLLRDASRGLSRRFEARTRDRGLSTTQWRLLGLVLADGPMTQAALADRLDVEPISVSRLIDRMETAGWVQRIPHPEDRRARLIIATDTARDAAAPVRRIVQDIAAEALSNLTEEETGILLKALVCITRTLEQGPQDTDPQVAGPKENDHE